MRSPQNHLWRGVDLRALVNSGHTNREIAEMVGATSGHVRVAINRAGLNSVIPSPETVRERAEGMKPLDAANYLLGVLEQWLPALNGTNHEVDGWGVDMTPLERLVLVVMVDAAPNMISRDQIMDCLYATRSDDEVPQSKIVDVAVSRLRKKLPARRGEILTVFGRGYKFERPA